VHLQSILNKLPLTAISRVWVLWDQLIPRVKQSKLAIIKCIDSVHQVVGFMLQLVQEASLSATRT